MSSSCDPIDCSLPGSSVHGIFQARILEWVAISFSRRSSWSRGWTQVSCIAGILYHLSHHGIPLFLCGLCQLKTKSLKFYSAEYHHFAFISDKRNFWLWNFRWIYLSFSTFSSVRFSHSVLSDSLQPHESQHARPPCPSPTPGVNSDSRPSSQWCHPAISSSVVPFSSCPQSLPASESFPMSQLFA